MYFGFLERGCDYGHRPPVVRILSDYRSKIIYSTSTAPQRASHLFEPELPGLPGPGPLPFPKPLFPIWGGGG